MAESYITLHGWNFGTVIINIIDGHSTIETKPHPRRSRQRSYHQTHHLLSRLVSCNSDLTEHITGVSVVSTGGNGMDRERRR
jgi:hypothetical protein